MLTTTKKETCCCFFEEIFQEEPYRVQIQLQIIHKKRFNGRERRLKKFALLAHQFFIIVLIRRKFTGF